MKEIHLICNSHLDPMWQWEWEEGAAAAVSTFRCAADFCEEFDGFIFNHNEALIYQWVEEYEPELFKKIQKLVQQNKWNIMGGWFVQPDCNMLQGESLLRQIAVGRKYFQDKFGVTVDCALNFDSFGHSRGLVQILAKTGFKSYQFVRPDYIDLGLSQRDFWWKGYDESKILAHNLYAGYGAGMGGATGKLKSLIEANPDFEAPTALYWGVGDHGGGPSRIDIQALNDFADILKKDGIFAFHSTPQQYFDAMQKRAKTLPTYEGHLRPSNRGCYTSQMRLKKKHRELENQLFMVEQMASMADMNGLMPYPTAELKEAERDLLFTEFHDVLPGSSIPPVEENGLQMLYHGMEILSRLRAKLFFALAQGQEKTPEGEIPILVYNPHPYEVIKDVECEFTLADHHWNDDTVLVPIAYCGEERLPSQLEKEYANTNLDWRKRVVFRATLKPSSINRFNCKLLELPILDGGQNDTWKTKQVHDKNEFLIENQTKFVFANQNMKAVIDWTTGYLNQYSVDGIDLLGNNGIRLTLCDDNEDSWGMGEYPVDRYLGDFQLATAERATEIAGVHQEIQSISIIENGEVRVVVEAIFVYNNSWAVIHYILPKYDSKIDIKIKIFSAETDKLFKLRIPVGISGEKKYLGQDVFGTTILPADGTEQVALDWVGVVSDNAFFGIINNCTYGVDCTDDSIDLSLLRNPAYCSHRLLERSFIPQDRYTARMDQGSFEYSFTLFGGNSSVMNLADRCAQAFNKAPYAVSFFPSGNPTAKPESAVIFENQTPVVMTSLQKDEGCDQYRIRAFNPSDVSQTVLIKVPVFGLTGTLEIPAKEVIAYSINKERINKTELL